MEKNTVNVIWSTNPVQVIEKLTNLHWFSVVWTPIYHDLRHHMVKMLWTREAQPNFFHMFLQLPKFKKKTLKLYFHTVDKNGNVKSSTTNALH
jgi:NAD-dependent SIR2 family protein deacetylase